MEWFTLVMLIATTLWLYEVVPVPAPHKPANTHPIPSIKIPTNTTAQEINSGIYGYTPIFIFPLTCGLNFLIFELIIHHFSGTLAVKSVVSSEAILLRCKK